MELSHRNNRMQVLRAKAFTVLHESCKFFSNFDSTTCNCRY